MKLRHVVLVAAAAGATAGVVVWHRHATAIVPTPLQIGFTDGTLHELAATDPAAEELGRLAGAVRDALEVAM